MPATPSTMLDLGTTLPPFRLPDYNGTIVSDRDFANAPGLAVIFERLHQPISVQARRLVEPRELPVFDRRWEQQRQPAPAVDALRRVLLGRQAQ